MEASQLPEARAGRELALGFTGTRPEVRAGEGLTALLTVTKDRYVVHFLTTHPQLPSLADCYTQSMPQYGPLTGRE